MSDLLAGQGYMHERLLLKANGELVCHKLLIVHGKKQKSKKLVHYANTISLNQKFHPKTTGNHYDMEVVEKKI